MGKVKIIENRQGKNYKAHKIKSSSNVKACKNDKIMKQEYMGK